MLGGLKNFVNSFVSPKPEDFLTRGWLTPEQFIAAGNQITMSGWQWRKTPSQIKPSVEPPDQSKHYLESNAVSKQRCSAFTKNCLKGNLDSNGFLLIEGDQVPQNIQNEEVYNYTITVTYDRKYHSHVNHQGPRIWLQGVNQETGDPLTAKEIFQDIMSEYQNETVTVEKHPFLGFQQVTIHPCNHSATTKNFIEKAKENGVELKPHQALFIFLKFMQSVMPTVVYDQIVDLTLGVDD